ncbi:hypothetical protein TNCV_2034441 [Trichonephila clavipes]|nr:hypothetical protein TNCV_2034441 [Trichonephila clavipes]
MGNVSKPEILRKLNIEPGDYTVRAMERLNKQRLLKAKYSCLQKERELGKKKDLKIGMKLCKSKESFQKYPGGLSWDLLLMLVEVEISLIVGVPCGT